jgi:hypothetical protein
MQAELVARESGIRVTIPPAGRIELYRDKQRDHEVVARATNGSVEITGLGIVDATVSKRGKESNRRSVELYFEDGQLYALNHGAKNPPRIDGMIDGMIDSYQMDVGEPYAIHRDCTLELGLDNRISILVSEGQGEEPPIAVYVQQCRKWLQEGRAQVVLGQTQGLLDEIDRREAADSDVTRDARDKLANVVTQIRGQCDAGAANEPVKDGIRQTALERLNRLERLYTR